MKTLTTTKPVDIDKERSEEKLSLQDFLIFYNKNIPAEFPRASEQHLMDFKKNHQSLFKEKEDVWTLGNHRKKFMDWLSSHIRELDRSV